LRYTAIALRWRIAATAIVALVVVGTASEQYWTQMGTILSDADYNRTDESGRMQIWRRGIGYMFQNPVFGVGRGNFQAAEGMLSVLRRPSAAGGLVFGGTLRTTAIYRSGAELGIPGLVIFIGMIASTFAMLRRVNRSSWVDGDECEENPRALTNALTASLSSALSSAHIFCPRVRRTVLHAHRNERGNCAGGVSHPLTVRLT
jgi:O-antigen ligase